MNPFKRAALSQSKSQEESYPIIPYENCPAKTFIDSSGEVREGFNVPDHIYIVACVANELISRLPASYQQYFFPDGTDLIVGCHDLGKVSPTFYLKLTEKIKTNNFPVETSLLKNMVKDPMGSDKSFGGHATISAIEIKHLLKDESYIVVGSHHGRLHQEAMTGKPEYPKFGGKEWHNQRVQLFHFLKEKLDTVVPEINSDIQVKVISGLTSVADWIGSGGKFSVPYLNWEETLSYDIKKTLDDAGYVRPVFKQGLSFNDIFPNIDTPNVLQEKVYDSLANKGVVLVEAPMGMGKTEAALYLAYKCLTEFDATGIYFALPTQLTSNKIFERFNEYLNQILDKDVCDLRSKLIHSQAWLLNTTMGEEGDVGGDWFDQAKRGLLAAFGVGTLDQALMSIISVKHYFVRSFGLMGKVVILDEVHTYDAYTGLLLDELIKHLVELKCTVIILSATFSDSRKKELLPFLKYKNTELNYPLVTAYEYESSVEMVTSFDAPSKIIKVVRSGESDAYEEALSRAESGQYVLWIENTVNEAIGAYRSFASCVGSGVEVGLLHSRFITEDRNCIESTWVNLYGKKNVNRHHSGKILVGSQILEQSLDIDADFLVTRFAPSDFILQRLGRLWRHDRSDRHADAACEAWVIAPEIHNAINDINNFGKSVFVYSPYILLKSLYAWEEYFAQKTLNLPVDIATIINETYEGTIENVGEVESTQLERQKYIFLNGDKNRKGLIQLKIHARSNLCRVGGLCDESAATRYMEMDTIELYLFKDVFETSDAVEFHCLDGEKIILTLSEVRIKGLSLKEKIIKLKCQKVRVARYLLKETIFDINFENININRCLKNKNDMVVKVDAIGGVLGLNGENIGRKEAAFYDRKIGLFFFAK